MGALCACGARTSTLEDFWAGGAGGNLGVAGRGNVASSGAGNVAGGLEHGGTASTLAGAPNAGFDHGGAAGESAGAGGALGAAGSAGAGGATPVCSSGVRGGGYVDLCVPPASGATSDCRAFDLVGAYSNGSMSESCTETVDDVSATSGVGIARGMLGDLHDWASEQFAESEDGLRVGAIGRTSGGELEFHLLELASGNSWAVPIAHDYSLAGVLSSGAFVGASLSNGGLIVDLIDPLTGNVSSVGRIADIGGWSSQVVLDRANNRAYALADPLSGPTNLYSIDLSNGSSSSKPLPWNGFLGGVTRNGQIVAMSTDGGGWTVSLIDPLTANATQQGPFANLNGASYLVYDAILGVAHTVSSNAQGLIFLYNFDLGHRATTQVEIKRSYFLAKQ